ncbi:MAG: CRTAC1 family protein [Thermoanaerobaculia bacterium]
MSRALCLLLALAAAPATAAWGEGFVDVTAAWGITAPTRSGPPGKTHIRETLGQGICWTDYDGDGDPDLLVLNGGEGVRGAPLPWRFYENRGRRFAEVSARAGLAVRAWALGCAVGDVDGDGRDDLFVTTATGPNRLFHNRGDRTFEDWTGRSGLAGGGLSTGAAFADLDGDGDLDLFVARYLDEAKPPSGDGCRWKGAPVVCGPKGYPPLDALLYRNRGDGRFVEVGRSAGIAGRPAFGLAVLTLDADGDGDSDVYVANDSTPSHLFLNRGQGRFEEWGLAAGVALSESGASQAGMGADAGDLDGDLREDLVKTNFSDDVHNFYHAEGEGVFAEWSGRSGLAAASFNSLGWSVLLEDFDLDGDLDVFVANGHVYPGVERFDPNTSYRQRPQLLFNDGRGNLSESPGRLGPAFARPILGRGAAAADFDGDGDLDLAVVRDGEPPLLLENRLPPPGAHWLKVRLRGHGGNREGIGARVEIEARGRRQAREIRRGHGYLSSGEAVLVFGLGSAASIDRLTVRWPGGKTQTLRNLGAGREWLVRQEEIK